MSPMIPLIDAHLDLAWNALSFNRDLRRPVAELRRAEAHMTDGAYRGTCTTSLPELRRAGVRVCVATLLARSGPGQARKSVYHRTDLDHANQDIAYAAAQGQLAYYRLLEAEGHLRMLRTREDLDTHWQDDHAPLGIILSMEGADPIVHPEQAEAWWNEGLRAAGLTHYGRSHYGYGTGVDGPLSERGVALLRTFENLGIALDVTHLCDKSMEQALEQFGGPVLASHHNCRSLVAGDRQLTDAQIRQLVARDAVIGTAMDCWMLYSGWERGVTSCEVVGLEAACDHIDHVCQIAGSSRHAAIGSDLDGGFGANQTPRELDTITDLGRLADILERRGYTRTDIEAVYYGNWLRFFRRALPQRNP